MFKNLNIEEINNKEELLKEEYLNKKEVKEALDFIITKIDENLEVFTEKFPSACTTNHKYRIKDNDDWTNGFWTGMLWMAYEYTGDEKYKIVGDLHTENFRKRYEDNFVLDHHDLGFLYSLSAVASYKVTGDKKARELGLLAAKKLKERYQEKGKFIQAWGKYGDEREYRLIIDCLLNLPLLYWAYDETLDESFLNVANNHFETAINTVIREDSSTYHTYYFDKETGKPKSGITHQGFNDESCWARGQAWAIIGMPLNYRYNKSLDSIEIFMAVTNYYLNRLPEDLIPYWDLVFKKEDKEPRDSSSAAIVACGIFEMEKYYDLKDKEVYIKAAHKMLRELISNYTTKDLKEADGILKHGVYAYHHNKGVDECNLWGDYFYMEALMRLYKKDFNIYW
ncbi:MAG: glycoside hydrolase family 88 protein [Clostridium chrysemydis]|uniref:glycoside hydrolase family 88 protein n=1 Tax=Clostridium chrysemydis TaxID=2665504 RepID=UPI003F34AAA1